MDFWLIMEKFLVIEEIIITVGVEIKLNHLEKDNPKQINFYNIQLCSLPILNPYGVKNNYPILIVTL